MDDLSRVVASPCHMEVHNACIKIGRHVKEGVEDIDASLSDKSILLSNHRVGSLVVTALNNQGIQISSAKTGDDLGVETAAGTRRVAASQYKRISKGHKRSVRNQVLSKVNAQAHKLGLTGTHPQQSYGHTAQGASPSQVSSMRHNI